MFFRLKKSGPRSYLQIVENRRDGRSVRQHVIATLGRIDELAAPGAWPRYWPPALASASRLCSSQPWTIPSKPPASRASASADPFCSGACGRRLGSRRPSSSGWRRRAFAFPSSGPVVATLHRLFVSGSDRDCATWMQDYAIPGAESLSLHHFYRAMAWLGEELPEERAGSRDALLAAHDQGRVEEALFARHRDLFTNLCVVFMDTTSLSFEGEGGETLGA